MSEYVDYLKEVFSEFGSVEPRRMFGGYGVFHKGLMFGLVAEEELYLKVDAEIELFFDALELPYFDYEKKGKRYRMSYRKAPESLPDDPDEWREWALRSYQAALRARK